MLTGGTVTPSGVTRKERPIPTLPTPPQHGRKPEDVGGVAADVADEAANNARMEASMAATFGLKAAANAAFLA